MYYAVNFQFASVILLFQLKVSTQWVPYGCNEIYSNYVNCFPYDKFFGCQISLWIWHKILLPCWAYYFEWYERVLLHRVRFMVIDCESNPMFLFSLDSKQNRENINSHKGNLWTRNEDGENGHTVRWVEWLMVLPATTAGNNGR